MTQDTCACEGCTCDVTAETAVEKDDQKYCSEGCASGHSDGAACCDAGCGCEC